MSIPYALSLSHEGVKATPSFSSFSSASFNSFASSKSSCPLWVKLPSLYDFFGHQKSTPSLFNKTAFSVSFLTVKSFSFLFTSFASSVLIFLSFSSIEALMSFSASFHFSIIFVSILLSLSTGRWTTSSPFLIVIQFLFSTWGLNLGLKSAKIILELPIVFLMGWLSPDPERAEVLSISCILYKCTVCGLFSLSPLNCSVSRIISYLFSPIFICVLIYRLGELKYYF